MTDDGKTFFLCKTEDLLLHSLNYRINHIVRTLGEEDISTTRQTVVKFIHKSIGREETATPPKPGKQLGRTPKLNLEHLNFLDSKLEKNDELCAVG